MSMIEDALNMSPHERFRVHQRALDLVKDLIQSKESLKRDQDLAALRQLWAIKEKSGQRGH